MAPRPNVVSQRISECRVTVEIALDGKGAFQGEVALNAVPDTRLCPGTAIENAELFDLEPGGWAPATP